LLVVVEAGGDGGAIPPDDTAPPLPQIINYGIGFDPGGSNPLTAEFTLYETLFLLPFTSIRLEGTYNVTTQEITLDPDSLTDLNTTGDLYGVLRIWTRDLVSKWVDTKKIRPKESFRESHQDLK
jgi:hypothetical protein